MLIILKILGGNIGDKAEIREKKEIPILKIKNATIPLSGNIETLEIITSELQNNKGALGRGIVGDVLFGIPGAIIGANSGKTKTEVCFRCVFKTSEWFIAKGDISAYQQLYTYKMSPLITLPQKKKAQNDGNKFYTKTWFIILMLFFFAPVGIYLMWKYTDYDNKTKKIISGVCAVWFAIQVIGSNNHHQPNQPARQTYQATVKQEPAQNDKDNKKSVLAKTVDKDTSNTPDFLKSSAMLLNIEIADINVTDFAEQNSSATGLTQVKGTFNKDGLKHNFNARFVTKTGECVRLSIDGEKQFYNEELQDKTMDEQRGITSE